MLLINVYDKVSSQQRNNSKVPMTWGNYLGTPSIVEGNASTPLNMRTVVVAIQDL